jgi:DNA-binding MarR family transcriptional regulator
MRTLRSKLESISEDERRHFWARAFDIIGPEWMIIVALADAERFSAGIGAISKTLGLNPSFVRAHVQLLEKLGHIECATDHDGSVVLSLTRSAEAKLGSADRG